MPDEKSLGQQTLDEYLTALASSQPAPGGGSGAAVSAAIGAALGEMVCNVTLARQSAPHRDELGQLLSQVNQLRALLMTLAINDERAYGLYHSATQLPKTTDAEKQQRHAAMQDALAAAAAVPLALARTCDHLIKTLAIIAQIGSRAVVSDAQTGAYFAAAAVQAAALNLRANAKMLDNQTAAGELVSQFETIARGIPSLVQAVDTAATTR